jgi:GTP-binding protein
MIIRHAEIFKISPDCQDFSFQQDCPRILFFGRSNVGKSSLINHLLQNKKIARTSSKPGKTTNFHWYLINQSFFFVDAPGYGYAKVPMNLRRHWESQFQLLLRQKNLLLIIHLVDIRHPLSVLDKKYHKIILQGATPYTIVATKSDTLSKNQKIKSVAALQKELKREVFPCSVKNSEDQKELWSAITRIKEENLKQEKNQPEK